MATEEQQGTIIGRWSEEENVLGDQGYVKYGNKEQGWNTRISEEFLQGKRDPAQVRSHFQKRMKSEVGRQLQKRRQAHVRHLQQYHSVVQANQYALRRVWAASDDTRRAEFEAALAMLVVYLDASDRSGDDDSAPPTHGHGHRRHRHRPY